MNTRLICKVAIILFVTIAGCALPSGPYNVVPSAIKADTDLVDYMLRSKGFTRETARLDYPTLETLAGQQAMLQPHFLRYWKNPYDFPKFAYGLIKDQAASCAKEKGIFELFGLGQVRTGHRAAFRFEYMTELKPREGTPVQYALLDLAKECEVALTAEDTAPLTDTLKSVPAELQNYIAKLVMCAENAKFYRDRALRNFSRTRWNDAYISAVRNFSGQSWETGDKEIDDNIINWDLGQVMDYDDLYTGAAMSIRGIVEMESALADWAKVLTETNQAKLDLSGVKFEFDTLLGKIAFNGRTEDNTYQGEDYLVIIDLGGNDTYKGAVAAAYKLEHPVSILIDNAGNDTYIADKTTPCAQGAGLLGYGFLVDNGGNDTFTAVNNAQGMCYFGVGILWDRGGDDSFKAHTAAQGSAAFGIANLVKTGGNDSYYAYYVSQGFGFIGAYGCLIDTDGNDKYVAEPYDIIHQAKLGHDNLRNYTFCQGAGWGQRGDIFGGHSMAGGTGILQDLSGNDWYECGVYGQATAYWYSTGILHDKSGDDHYEGSFFVQSSGVHMGITMLLEESGNDTYHAWRAISQAGAHDLAVSFLVDKAGNDKYSAWGWKDEKGAQTLTNTGKKGQDGGVFLGSAINNTIAMFVNIGGDDSYEFYTKDAFAWSNQNAEPGTWRYENFNLGMFIDIGGKDDYQNLVEPPPEGLDSPKNNSSWSRMNMERVNKNKVFSMGIDIEKGKVPEAGE